MNQAIFEAIWIADDEEIRSDLASPVKEAHAIKDDIYDETKRSIRSIQSKARKRRDSDGLVPVGVGAAENEEAPNPGEAGSGDFARGLTSASMVGLLGSYSNPEVQGRLRQLSDKLDRLAASDAVPRPSARQDRKLRAGMVPKVIERVLADSGKPMRARDIHVEVEELLCQSVPASSVKNWLAKQAQDQKSQVVRLGRGRYRLA